MHMHSNAHSRPHLLGQRTSCFQVKLCSADLLFWSHSRHLVFLSSVFQDSHSIKNLLRCILLDPLLRDCHSKVLNKAEACDFIGSLGGSQHSIGLSIHILCSTQQLITSKQHQCGDSIYPKWDQKAMVFSIQTDNFLLPEKISFSYRSIYWYSSKQTSRFFSFVLRDCL